LLDLVSEQAALSPEMAMRVEKAFDLSMDILLRIAGMP
jgi:plasmid maintenance system antidote protein VapI